MRKLLFYLLLVMTVVSCTKSIDYVDVNENSPNLKNGSLNTKYIVVLNRADMSNLDFKERNDLVKSKSDLLLKKYNINKHVEEIYETAIDGFTVRLTKKELLDLQSDPIVKRVEMDQIVSINARGGKKGPPPPPPPTPTPTQNIPWGITRVGYGDYNGLNKVWVIDTGIDLTHPDLNVSQTLGVSFVSGVSSPNDDNGHGTHVAGTIGAKNNSFGVIGVAAGAMVIPLKSLDATGSGVFSSVLSAINHVGIYANVGDVVNMSIGGGVSPTIDESIKTIAGKGILFSVAAGNESDYIYNHSPARASIGQPNIYAVTAMYSGNTWASFSNYGEGADYCAPGVSVYSTYKNGGYASMSGTSMAAPHVSGLLLWGTLHGDGFVTGDPDGNPDPIAHK